MMADINCKYYNSFIGNHKTVRFFEKKNVYKYFIYIQCPTGSCLCILRFNKNPKNVVFYHLIININEMYWK